MIGRWLRRMLFGKGVRVWPRGRQNLQYQEDGRRMTIAAQMLTDGFEIAVCSIVTWDDSNGELINEAERQRILQNVRSYLESKGEKVVLG